MWSFYIPLLSSNTQKLVGFFLYLSQVYLIDIIYLFFCLFFLPINLPLINIEQEHKKLRDELLAAKAESDKLLASLLDSDRIRKEQEDLIDFLRRNEVKNIKSAFTTLTAWNMLPPDVTVVLHQLK